MYTASLKQVSRVAGRHNLSEGRRTNIWSKQGEKRNKEYIQLPDLLRKGIMSVG
jgi:hypothetical protein